MDHAIPMLALLGIALLAAGAMGLAIQRGATCMVAAVDEAYSSGKFSRAGALAEASLWVAGPIALGSLLGYGLPAAKTFNPGAMAIAGGMLLGFGAVINSACVFGSIARVGSGNWHYLLVPPAFFVGSWFHSFLAIERVPITSAKMSQATLWLLVGLFLASLIGRLAELAIATRRGAIVEHMNQPRIATITIGLTFVVLFLVAGPWAYTEVLDQLAHGGMGFGGLQIALLFALLFGAVAGGWRGRTGFNLDGATAARCVIGGGLMGFGSALIPGGNDNLILSGIPNLQAYAWVAISAMVLAIWTGLIVARNWRTLLRKPQLGNSA